MGSPLWGRAIVGCDVIARPRRSAAATPSSSLFVSLKNRLGQMATLFLAGPLTRARCVPLRITCHTNAHGSMSRDRHSNLQG